MNNFNIELHVPAIQVTTDEFIDLINSFKGPLVCPICACSSWDVQGVVEGMNAGEPWGVMDVVESLNYAQLKKDGKTISFPGGLPVFRITCTTCAYMMLFSYKRVRSIIDANAAMKNKEGQKG
ncbi:hypothetical protein G3755_004058 [Salmonella enterica]|uniref:hypothetical protein n=1 Tax=Salmonella enterica TaxID=28901 RepID=UPI00128793CB|nr:hypothetical protein [Salmonella enterica]EAO5523872.1 hypothetical protein [Salmonella enterica subsp. enterica serovar Hvittingfoss]EBQ9004390.1 hypothetical protein [Salmonella enterica subsp. enterica serovar Blockley]ECU7995200.1 hypothetical protein [Salmonella enterica subsp. enterica serovar Toucra]EAS0616497.1 hypothetical protein [Salmonella enterica]